MLLVINLALLHSILGKKEKSTGKKRFYRFVKIVSENPYCASCQGVIQQFSEMFPNIEIKLIDGIR
ncbi:MAG: deaminase domain-containing protein [Allomuricauda sp.]